RTRSGQRGSGDTWTATPTSPLPPPPSWRHPLPPPSSWRRCCACCHSRRQRRAPLTLLPRHQTRHACAFASIPPTSINGAGASPTLPDLAEQRRPPHASKPLSVGPRHQLGTGSYATAPSSSHPDRVVALDADRQAVAAGIAYGVCLVRRRGD